MYEDYVTRGAKLLDELRPGWWREVACDRLGMESCQDCVLGQIYGHYLRGCEAIQCATGDPHFSPVETGFNLLSVNPITSARDRYDDLADAWRDEIRRREAEAAYDS